MADLTITAAQLTPLATVLSAMTGLTPPPNPKGRYVLGKLTPLVIGEQQKHELAIAPMLDDFATVDEDGVPIFHLNPNGSKSFTVRPEKMEEWLEIQATIVTLPGIRQITRAELGACPITIDQEMVLVSCGVLEDAEPA